MLHQQFKTLNKDTASPYQTKSLSKSRHSVPGCNEKSGWKEISINWKYFLKLIPKSLHQSGIGCLPVEEVPTPTQVKVVPVRSDQWSTKEWKSTNKRAAKCESEGENSIGVHLHTG